MYKYKQKQTCYSYREQEGCPTIWEVREARKGHAQTSLLLQDLLFTLFFIQFCPLKPFCFIIRPSLASFLPLLDFFRFQTVSPTYDTVQKCVSMNAEFINNFLLPPELLFIYPPWMAETAAPAETLNKTWDLAEPGPSVTIDSHFSHKYKYLTNTNT